MEAANESLAESNGGIWGKHLDHPVEDWQYEVANGDSRQGYWDWVAHRIELASE